MFIYCSLKLKYNLYQFIIKQKAKQSFAYKYLYFIFALYALKKTFNAIIIDLKNLYERGKSMENTAVQTKVQKKGRKARALGITAGIIIAVAVIAVIFISIVTKPQKDTDENLVAVGGMVYSDTV